METPPTSAAHAVAPITSLSPRRVVMIDDLMDVVLDEVADENVSHPANTPRSTRRRAGVAGRSTAGSGPSTRRCPPITCTNCQVTYMTTVALPPSVSPEGWVCDVCLRDLLMDAPPVPNSLPDRRGGADRLRA